MADNLNTTIETLYIEYQDILLKTLSVLPVGYIPLHTFENIPSMVSKYVKRDADHYNEIEKLESIVEEAFPNFFDEDKVYTCYNIGEMLIEKYTEANNQLTDLKKRILHAYNYFAGFGSNLTDSLEQLNFVIESKVKGVKNILSETSLQEKYKIALEEICKRPQKSETCKMIAQKALGLLNDDDYQPELLIEENLKLKMEVEDLKAKLIKYTIGKVFPQQPISDYEKLRSTKI